MPHLDGTGPENKGSKTGRKLGKCTKASRKELMQKLGKGLGKRRKADICYEKGKRV